MTQVLIAFIDESNCIGCSKCIRVCPTDAIVGSKHYLHTIIPQLCTSCEECINVCPTDCISLKTPHIAMSEEQEQQLRQKKQQRLSAAKSALTVVNSTNSSVMMHTPEPLAPDERKKQIADAIARVQARKKLINN
ncbi:RnfABCDGE type electron transport complex subunit B [Orbus sturtevantii]|uniref:RnfABCDGE type electron transport complex subunit B n=1 Tax=Orbus sturtevantii TaxID=3074109 RepID=UPI00370D39F2